MKLCLNHVAGDDLLVGFVHIGEKEHKTKDEVVGMLVGAVTVKVRDSAIHPVRWRALVHKHHQSDKEKPEIVRVHYLEAHEDLSVIEHRHIDVREDEKVVLEVGEVVEDEEKVLQAVAQRGFAYVECALDCHDQRQFPFGYYIVKESFREDKEKQH